MWEHSFGLNMSFDITLKRLRRGWENNITTLS
jgi:hypothetical protein